MSQLVYGSQCRQNHVAKLIFKIGGGCASLSAFDERSHDFAPFLCDLSDPDPVASVYPEPVQMGTDLYGESIEVLTGHIHPRLV
ncbi:hypothetical protein ACNQVK_00695 [Mycobacterium sp. 134]|uniref:hypothetical protein n=1 Tax=Mycobacterium sp. 134 TaxID=3400425 RepID=UPI003AAE8553